MKISGKFSIMIKTSTLLLSTAILFWRDLIIIMNEALNSDLITHILIIPPLLTYILYRIRKILTETMSNRFTNHIRTGSILVKDITGTLLCLIAYLVKLYGSYTFHPLEYHIASLCIFIAGLTLIIFNIQTLRTLLFSIFFITFLIPPPLELAQKTGSALATLSSQVAYSILTTIRIPVSISSTYMSPVIYLKTESGTQIPFAVDIACSGLYSLIGFTVFAVFTAYITREALQKKLLILVLGLPLIYVLNIFRITLIIIIGHLSGPTLALNIFHLLGGWTLILIGTLIILAVSEKIFNLQILKARSKTCSHSHKNNEENQCMECGKVLKAIPNKLSGKDATKIALIITFTTSLLFIQVPVFALTEGVAEVFIQQSVGGQMSTNILPDIEGYAVKFIYRDVEFEKISGQNASLIFQYSPLSPRKPIWVGIEIAPTRGQLHPWEVCLITAQENLGREPQVVQLDIRDIHIFDNPPLSARYFAFQRKDSNETQVILYWYTRSIFKTAEGHQQKWTKISVIEFTYDPKEYRTIEEELLPVAKAIANYWQPITNWSWISLTIAKNGPKLITITATLLIGFLAISLYLEIKKKINVKRIYSRISDPQDQNIIDSIKALKREIATETKISSMYKEITGEKIDLEILRNKLTVAEEINIINRKIININDEPYITWK
ncbi:MAG: exosortase/archaeosortase family protein, partial [Candidatus Hodarchaeota archaeon]